MNDSIVFERVGDAINWIIGERWKGEKNGLENTRALLKALGDPQTRMGKIVHVAGTNGKGSTCAFIERGLRECGYKTGLFTSPYLCCFQERIRLNGKPISDEKLISVAKTVAASALELSGAGVFCTTFELLTAAACLFFAEENVDYSVIEVGMGGRLDSTNVLSPTVSVIAAIGMDHMQRLGNTIEDIAREKAGIIKPGVPCVALSQQETVMRVFRDYARTVKAPLFETGKEIALNEDAFGSRFSVDLPAYGLLSQSVSIAGGHQMRNAALALTALDRLDIDMKKASAGVALAKWQGRLEWVSNVLIDCAHNPQGANALCEYLKKHMKDRKTVLLTGMMHDKQIDACASVFGSFADCVVATRVEWQRALPAEELANTYLRIFPEKAGRVYSRESVSDALALSKKLAGDDGVVVVAGSVYVAGDVRRLMLPSDDMSL